MLKKIILIILFSFYNFHIYAFEPYSGISCHSDRVKEKKNIFLNMMKIISMQLLTKGLTDNSAK